MVNKYSCGLTLIELLICLSILGILFGIGLPFTPLFYQKNEIDILQNDIQNAILFSKMETMILGEPLRLMPFKHDWTLGMTLVTLKEQKLRVWEWHSNIHVIWHGFQSKKYLQFSPSMNQSAMNGYFLLEPTHGRCVKLMVNRLGRVRIV